MKKRLYIFKLFFLVAFVCLGQSNVYHPMPDSNAVWTQTYTYYWTQCDGTGLNPLIHDLSFSYFLDGDVVINTYTYHKIYKTGTEHVHCLSNFSGGSWYTNVHVYAGAYRQDTALKKVFYRDPSGSESLLYDFNAVIGATISTQCALTVISIDSVLIGATYRKRFNLSGLSSKKIIEGIGSTAGLLEPCDTFEKNGNLICFKQNNKKLYPDTINQCQVMTGINEIKRPLIFAIAPNPSSGIYNITGLQNECVFEVFDINGRSVYKKSVTEHSATIDLTQNNKGIYYYRVVDPYGNSGHGTLGLE